MTLPTRFGVSGCPEIFTQLSQQWLGFLPNVEKISLPSVIPAQISLEVMD